MPPWRVAGWEARGDRGSMEAPSKASRPTKSVASRAFRLFLRRLESRSTLLATLLVAVVIGVALVAVRNGLSWGGFTGREGTDDAYVRADQIGIASHIAGYIETVPVDDNQTVHEGQLVATIRD